jgi:hypothetical protein
MASLSVLFMMKLVIYTYTLVTGLIYGISMAAMGISFVGVAAIGAEIGTWLSVWLPALAPLSSFLHGLLWTQVQTSPATLSLQAAAPWVSQSYLAGGAAVSSVSCLLQRYGR